MPSEGGGSLLPTAARAEETGEAEGAALSRTACRLFRCPISILCILKLLKV